MEPTIPTLPVPPDCATCAAACPLKRKGCAFDAAQTAMQLEANLAALGVPANMADVLDMLREKARTCRQEVTAQVEEHNRNAAQAQVLLKLILPALQQLLPTAAPASEAPGEAADPEAPAEESEGKRRSRGRDANLLLDPADEAREAEALAAGVHSLCVAPTLVLEDWPAFKLKLEKRFTRAPFEALVLAVARRHRDNPERIRVTAYYRGPPPKEAQPILKAQLEAEKAAGASA